MGKKILIFSLILLAEAAIGYYSIYINGSFFARFIFFIACALLVCVIVIRSVQYILPGEDEYSHEKDPAHKIRKKLGQKD